MVHKMVSMSTLTEKSQATIPADIRHRLKLIPGDKVGFEVSEGEVFLRRVEPFDYLYHQSLSKTLSEWESAEENELGVLSLEDQKHVFSKMMHCTKLLSD